EDGLGARSHLRPRAVERRTDRDGASRRRARRRGPLQQGGGRGAVPTRPGGRGEPVEGLREARHPLANAARRSALAQSVWISTLSRARRETYGRTRAEAHEL